MTSMSANPRGEGPLRAGLFAIGLNSSDPRRLADFYRDALGYMFSETAEGLYGVGRDRRLSIGPGPSRTLAYAAYRLDDAEGLAALTQRLAAAEVPFEPVRHEGLAPSAIAVRDPDGNRLIFGFADGSGAAPPAAAVEASTGERPARLQHVVFATKAIEPLLTFFTEVLGFTLSDSVLDEAGRLTTAFLRCSDEHHSVAIFAASESRLDHHCYEAGAWDLIRDWADHFASRHVPIKWGPGRHGPGNNLFLFVHDPDGNWVEISAELERVEPGRPPGTWPHSERTLNAWGPGLLRS
jgi:catechol 2,3-dioxygenase-like lactoylglutathione lyase family enzyme